MASVEKRGEAWRARVRRSGTVLYRTCDTEAEAVAWAADTEARLVSGAVPAAPEKSVNELTVAELFDRYARTVSPEKGAAQFEINALRKIGRHFTEMAEAGYGPTLATGVTGPVMAAWRDRRKGEISGSSINRELSTISSVFNTAIKEWGLSLAVNPVGQIMRPKNNPSRRRRVTPDEQVKIVKFLTWSGKTAPGTTRHWVAWVFCLCLETGMRVSEALRMTWDHVHLDKRFVHLPKTKNGHARDVPLSRKALALFLLLPEAHRLGRVVPVNYGTFGVYWREALTDAEIEDLHFHDTRREAATQTAKKLSVMELAKMIGHRDLRYTMVYYEPDPTELADKLG